MSTSVIKSLSNPHLIAHLKPWKIGKKCSKPRILCNGESLKIDEKLKILKNKLRQPLKQSKSNSANLDCVFYSQRNATSHSKLLGFFSCWELTFCPNLGQPNFVEFPQGSEILVSEQVPVVSVVHNQLLQPGGTLPPRAPATQAGLANGRWGLCLCGAVSYPSPQPTSRGWHFHCWAGSWGISNMWPGWSP